MFDHFWWKSTFQTWNHFVLLLFLFLFVLCFFSSSQFSSFRFEKLADERTTYNIHKQWYASFSVFSLCRIIHILYIWFFSMVIGMLLMIFEFIFALLHFWMLCSRLFLLFFFSLLCFIHFFQCFFFFLLSLLLLSNLPQFNWWYSVLHRIRFYPKIEPIEPNEIWKTQNSSTTTRTKMYGNESRQRKKWNIENRMRHRKGLTEKVNEKDSKANVRCVRDLKSFCKTNRSVVYFIILIIITIFLRSCLALDRIPFSHKDPANLTAFIFI